MHQVGPLQCGQISGSGAPTQVTRTPDAKALPKHAPAAPTSCSLVVRGFSLALDRLPHPMQVWGQKCILDACLNALPQTLQADLRAVFEAHTVLKEIVLQA